MQTGSFPAHVQLKLVPRLGVRGQGYGVVISNSEQADGSNYRDDSKTIDESAEGSNYRDDSEEISDVADGSNLRDDSKGISDVADGSNYRDDSEDRRSRAPNAFRCLGTRLSTSPASTVKVDLDADGEWVVGDVSRLECG